MPQRWGRQTKVKFLGGEVVFKLSGGREADEYVKDLNGIAARGKNLQPAMEKILTYLMASTSRTFEAEGRPAKWKPLSPYTIQDRAEQGFPPGPILVRTGKLKKSLTQPGATGSIQKATPRTVQYGSSLPYFQIHQVGTSDIPKRVMVLLQQQDKAQVSRIINTYIREGKV